MREVSVIVKCDRCLDPLDSDGDKPVDKWVILGRTYRVELCDDCQEQVLDELHWLNDATPVTKKKGGKRTSGKFAPKLSTCHICGRTFATPAGVSQHLAQAHPDRVGVEIAAPKLKVCEFCGATFATARGRGGHEYNAHREQWKARKENAA